MKPEGEYSDEFYDAIDAAAADLAGQFLEGMVDGLGEAVLDAICEITAAEVIRRLVPVRFYLVIDHEGNVWPLE